MLQDGAKLHNKKGGAPLRIFDAQADPAACTGDQRKAVTINQQGPPGPPGPSGPPGPQGPPGGMGGGGQVFTSIISSGQLFLTATSIAVSLTVPSAGTYLLQGQVLATDEQNDGNSPDVDCWISVNGTVPAPPLGGGRLFPDSGANLGSQTIPVVRTAALNAGDVVNFVCQPFDGAARLDERVVIALKVS